MKYVSKQDLAELLYGYRKKGVCRGRGAKKARKDD
jgi:hypothetical protein